MPTPTSSERFGRWLYQNRKQNRLTQQELASAARCSPSYISMLERVVTHPTSGGSLRPTEEMVEALAVGMGADVDDALLAAGYAPRGMPIRPTEADSPTETRELHDDTLEEFSRTYRRLEGERWFRGLDEMARIDAVRSHMEARRRPARDWYAEREPDKE